jgi:hypothetical protein
VLSWQKLQPEQSWFLQLAMNRVSSSRVSGQPSCSTVRRVCSTGCKLLLWCWQVNVLGGCELQAVQAAGHMLLYKRFAGAAVRQVVAVCRRAVSLGVSTQPVEALSDA